jgi:hypothetical protein
VVAITADRRDGITAGLAQLPVAMRALRGRLLDLADGLDDAAWSGPSRCHLWTPHQVLRHVRDACRLHVDGLRRTPYGPFDKPFDNRATPQEWLARSEGQTTGQTLDELRSFSAQEAAAFDARLEAPGNEIVGGPYGPIPWSILSAHVHWDAWLHERDVARMTGGGRPSAPVEEAFAAAYSLFICSMAAILMGIEPFTITVGLSEEDRHYVASVLPGHVELHSAATTEGTDLQGSLGVVVDSLAGRGPAPAEVLHGDPANVEPFCGVRARLAPPVTRAGG